VHKKLSLSLLLLLVLIALVLPGTAGHTAAANLITNPSVETADATGAAPQNWQHNVWGTNTTTFSYLTNGQDGTRSVSVKVTSYADGDAKWYFNPVSVSPNTAYTFSDYYEASVTTSLVAWIVDAAGNSQYLDVGAVNASSSWTKAQFTFTTPANAQTLTIFHLINQVGDLQTDNYSLQGATPTTPVITDNVPNNSLEQVSPSNPSQPLAWATNRWGTNKVKFSYLNTGHTGSHSVKTQITSYTNGDAKWYYTPQPASAGVTYKFTDYYEANITSKVVIMVNITDGSTQYINLHTADLASAWTQYSDTFTTPPGTQTVSVFHLIEGVGYVITDDYSLTSYTPVGFNRGLVSLTFDDGWQSQYTNALPLLNSYNDKATFYLVPDFLNTMDYLTSAQANALQQAGNEIGSHTMDHPDLTTLSSAALIYQLQQSQQILQAQFGTTIQDFASPYGAYNSQVISAIKQYYRSHRSTDTGYNSKDNFNMYNIRTQNILSTTTVSEVNTWLQEAKNDKTWLVIVFHQVDTTGQPDGITPANLNAILTNISNQGLPVDTVDQAISELTPQL
jgi:peptidoglycan/xylan/chitin deacetylase (PgdA/CDA1 family)